MSEAERRQFSHIGRIMETELGVQLDAEHACTQCKQLGEECWVYSSNGRKQIRHPGDTCARCRVIARQGGCSVSSRRKLAKKSPGQNSLAPLRPRASPSPSEAR